MPARLKITFAGITFSAVGRGGDVSEFVTVPKPAFRKILASGKVKVVCNYNHTDEAAYRGPTGEVNPDTLLAEIEQDSRVTYKPQKGEMTFSPHGGKGYTITQK